MLLSHNNLLLKRYSSQGIPLPGHSLTENNYLKYFYTISNNYFISTFLVVGDRIIGMKRLLVILVLLISFCNISYAEEIVNLPNDTSSGYKKLFKSLSGNYYKDDGLVYIFIFDNHLIAGFFKGITHPDISCFFIV